MDLYMEKDALTNEELDEVLQLDWTKEFLENAAGGERAGMSEYCVPIICSWGGAKD